MPRLRRILLLVAGALAFSAGSAYAATRPTSTDYPLSVPTTHFVVHYSGDKSKNYHIDQTIAGDLGAYAERAYALYKSSWGYKAPLDDSSVTPDNGGDGKTDIYVVDLKSASTGHRSLTYPDNDSATTSSAFIELDYTNGLTLHTVAHAVFDASALGVWNATNRSLIEGAADWAAYVVDDYSAFSDSTGGFDSSLDCYDPSALTASPGHGCGHAGESGTFDNNFSFDDGMIGSSRWPFFEYLAEHFGNTAMLSVLQSAAAQSDSPATLLNNYLVTKGSSLATVYNDWADAAVRGDYTPTALQKFLPNTYTSILTGTLASLNPNRTSSQPLMRSGAIPSRVVPVDHLATRFVKLEKGDGVDSGPCFAATLTLNVTIPSGSSSQPYFQWEQRNSLGQLVQSGVALSVSGSTATATVPWDTCKWDSTAGYLALPNASLTADSLDFTVAGTLSIDTSTVGASGAPSLPFDIPGTVVAVPTSDGIPQLDLLGPATIHVDPDQSELRVIVISNGSGSVQLTLNGILLGTFGVRAGTNDVRTGLPLQALLSAPKTAKTLLLTPFSPGGQAGTPLARTLVVDPSPATAKAKKAKKAKKKHALKRKAARRRL